jgi:hypothetical protein
MVASVIAFPGMVLASLESGPKIDPSKVQLEIPQTAPEQSPQIDFK